MKKLIYLFLAVTFLCTCLTACRASDSGSDSTTEPTIPSTTEPSVPGISVTPPGDMPEKPDADYTLPPEQVTIPAENISDR